MSLSDISGIHDRIAADVCKGKTHRLHCLECGVIRAISQSEYADYLAHGWPKCCGYTMRLEEHK
jgi:hypothetical protein